MRLAGLAAAGVDRPRLRRTFVDNLRHATARLGEAGIRLQALRADGGAAANNLLMQMQADILGVAVQRPAVTETTALGAAYLAGLATGYWPGVDELQAQWRVDAQFEPAMPAEERDRLYSGWQRAVERARGWIE